MSDVTIYGSGDDLIEIEGDAGGCDEYPGEDDRFVLIGEDGGQLRVRVRYTERGTWAIMVEPVDEDIPILCARLEPAERGYTPQLVVSGVRTVIHEAKGSQ